MDVYVPSIIVPDSTKTVSLFVVRSWVNTVSKAQQVSYYVWPNLILLGNQISRFSDSYLVLKTIEQLPKTQMVVSCSIIIVTTSYPEPKWAVDHAWLSIHELGIKPFSSREHKSYQWINGVPGVPKSFPHEITWSSLIFGRVSKSSPIFGLVFFSNEMAPRSQRANPHWAGCPRMESPVRRNLAASSEVTKVKALPAGNEVSVTPKIHQDPPRQPNLTELVVNAYSYACAHAFVYAWMHKWT